MANQGSQVSCSGIFRLLDRLLSYAAPRDPPLCVRDSCGPSQSSHAFTHVTGNDLYATTKASVLYKVHYVCVLPNFLMGLTYRVLKYMITPHEIEHQLPVVAILSYNKNSKLFIFKLRRCLLFEPREFPIHPQSVISVPFLVTVRWWEGRKVSTCLWHKTVGPMEKLLC